MARPSRRHVRAVFAAVLILAGGALATSFLTADPGLATTSGRADEPASPLAPGAPSAAESALGGADADPPGTTGPPAVAVDDVRKRDPAAEAGRRGPDARVDPAAINASWSAPGNLTVVTTQGFYVSDEQGELVAFTPEGEVVYHDDAYRTYFDVDPVAGTRYTVEYVAAAHRRGSACPSGPRCTDNVVRRVNLSTGVDRAVYGERTPRVLSSRWHDVDRIDDDHLAIADIYADAVRVVNVTSGRTVRSWTADDRYDRSAGGRAGDWTHLNDVEVLSDGRLLASVRNMDEVVFLDLGRGVDADWTSEPADGDEPDGGDGPDGGGEPAVDANWTLGDEDDHGVLYEQHNPDYVPPERGGPAVVVADSENGRVLEYRRVDPETGEPATGPDGEWRRSWGWRDARLQWPRDADRLPDGTTLVTDSHGDRVVAVHPNGSVGWSVSVSLPYEAERLGTGDESAGGPSAAAMRVAKPRNASVSPAGTVTRPDRGPVGGVLVGLRRTAPSLVVNGVLYAAPAWVRFTDLVLGAVCLLAATGWLLAELRWWRDDLFGAFRATDGESGNAR